MTRSASGETAQEGSVVPWVERGGVPLPDTVASVVVLHEDEPVNIEPRADAPRRGSLYAGARLPLYAARTGPGCAGKWLMVGPLAWVCRNRTDLSEGAPLAAFDVPRDRSDGLPFAYYFVGRGGSAAYGKIELADQADPDMELQPGFGVAVVREKGLGGNAYGLTHHGLWVPMRDLVPVRPQPFHGEEIRGGVLDLAWVLDEKTPTFSRPDGVTRAKETRARFEIVRVLEEVGTGDRALYKIGETTFIRAKDVRRPRKLAPPTEVARGERWIDVDTASQTLVAYQGETPVFATLVSTGKGASGTPTGTTKGVHRIWVKLRTSTMDNLEDQNASSTFQIEDVPYVQYFSKGVALHGAFWHNGFGRIRSHGCVNLSPVDAQRLFHFTGPNLPAGWSASLPTEFERGTVVRVR